MPTRHLIGSCALLMLGVLVPVTGRTADLCAGDEIVAIEFLGKADCRAYPEAQTVLIDSLKNDPREKVRYAAVMAITRQLQQGKAPLDATSGWRQVPDPEILTQICRLAQFRCPLTRQELYSAYKLRQEACASNGGGCADCCSPEVLDALARTAYERDLFCCWIEPSDRIRWRAERALTLCCGEAQIQDYMQQHELPPESKVPMVGETPNTPEDLSTRSQSQFGGQDVLRSFGGSDVPILGRADFSNRFNIFDNMNAAPRSRVFYGFQYAQSQNNAVFQTGDTNQLFSILDTEAGRGQFISLTGFGRQPNQPAIDPHDPSSKQNLQDQFLVANGGRSTKFLANPDTNLHRFGAEWALTTDFSLTLVGQYIMPSSDNEQPNSFSNPSIQLKHVLYRDEDFLMSGVLSIQPQISRPQFGIGEDTTRLAPGLLTYHRLSERLFMQNAVGFSFPTESNQITTFDFAIGGGYWAYKDESLEAWYRGPKSEKWVLGFIPQFEALGKAVIGSNTVVGSFDLSRGTALTAPGTVSPVDGTRNIYFPNGTQFQESSFIYRESKGNVDLTFGASTIFKNDFVYSAAVSVPVTGGDARALEFISTLNKYF